MQNWSNQSDWQPEPPDHYAIFYTPRRIVGYWQLISLFVGVPMNLLVLYLTTRFYKQPIRRRGFESRRHQSNLLFVFSMTLADFCFSCVNCPMMFGQYVLGVNYDTLSCFSLYVVTYASTISSSISLLWLNVDKFLYLSEPLRYHRRVTPRAAAAVTLVTWMTGLSWALFFMLGPFSVYKPPCEFRPARIHLYMATCVCFFVLPTFVSLLISVYIAALVARVERENAQRRHSSAAACNAGSQHRRSRQLPGVVLPRSKVTLRTIGFVFTTTIWSSLTCLPYRFAYLVYVTPGLIVVRSYWMTASFYLLFALMSANPIGNPFITIITQRQYTTAVKCLLRNGRLDKDFLRRDSNGTSLTYLYNSNGGGGGGGGRQSLKNGVLGAELKEMLVPEKLAL